MPYATWKDAGKDIKIHYEVVGNPDGETIIFHHGNGNTGHNWIDLGYADRLGDDFQLVLIDSRGYGKSSKPHDPAAYSLKSRAQDTIAVLDDLKFDKVHCLGGSVGGSMCFILARFFPERFKSFIFATPYFIQFDDNCKKALVEGSAACLQVLENKYGKFEKSFIRQTFLANDAKALLAANTSEWFDYHDYIQYVKVPSMIYAGSEEVSVPALRELATQLPDCELHVIPNTAHAEAYWDGSVNAPLIRDFVNKVSR